MNRLKDKKIILGITGSIAAYKTPQLVRLMVKEGADVHVIMTPNAGLFVTQLSLSTVSGNPALETIQSDGHWNNHVLLGRAADLMLIAPCSANTLGKMANGLCDNLLLATYLSTHCPIMVAPAMDEDMWQHPTIQNNIERLKTNGHKVLPVGVGELASGLVGAGRMEEPEAILEAVIAELCQGENQELISNQRKKALVTAGPTHEAIDPVRFIGNHSSGKMGSEIAIALADKGFEVNLVTGPGVNPPINRQIHVHQVTTAIEMQQACEKYFKDAAITVMAAAVADYRPAHPAAHKIKKDKNESKLQLELIQNPDILAHLGEQKKENQILVGFALETDHEYENAAKKLKSKRADYMVLNSLEDKGAGFGTDTNKVTVFKANGEKIPLPLQSKRQTADAIISLILS